MKKLVFAFVTLSFILQGCSHKSDSRRSFYQDVKTEVVLPDEIGQDVRRLFLTDKGPVIITPSSVARQEESGWKKLWEGEPIYAATMDRHNQLWIAVDDRLICLDNQQINKLPEDLHADSIQCLYQTPDGNFHLGTNRGLYSLHKEWTEVTEFTGISVNDLIADAEETLWAATSNGLWQHKKGKQWVNLDETLMAVGNHRTYFALATANEGKDLVFSAPFSVGIIAADGDHQAWRGPDGLPYGPARLIRTTGESLWLGTTKGAICKRDHWSYYHGKRWLADSVVNDIAEIRPGTVWIATPKGISEIERRPMTLARKADYYADIIEKRHNRRGLVNISKLRVPGDISTSYTENEDNDGLWTSCFLGAECFRYAVTKSEEARQRAIRTFEALERLELVTGIPGYPARSYALASDSVVQSRSPHPKKWHLSEDGQWQWLDDTSSDEITGHLFTLSLFYELVADDSYRRRAVSLIDRIVTHIIDHDFHLIDEDGKPTRWGVWHPDSLNHASNWMYEKNLNSLQLLSHLKTAYHYTRNEKYEEIYQRMIRENGYAANAVQAKIYGPFETSHSDDILNFFPYYGLFQYTQNDPYRAYYVKSLERTWKAVRNDRMPVWNVIASALLRKDCDLEVAEQELQEYPLDLIDWTMENSHRWDLPADPLVDRSGRRQALRAIPCGEASVSRWNTNPKRYDSGRDGKTEETGTWFLFAYWMGRYHGFFE